METLNENVDARRDVVDGRIHVLNASLTRTNENASAETKMEVEKLRNESTSSFATKEEVARLTTFVDATKKELEEKIASLSGNMTAWKDRCGELEYD